MSRVGKQVIPIPKGVEVKIDNATVQVKGPKGSLECEVPAQIMVKHQDDKIVVERKSHDRRAGAFHGLTRTLINNMVVGVSEGFSRQLQINGVGYKAEVKGSGKLDLILGYSHPITYELPEGVQASVDKGSNTITVQGCDKGLVGRVVAKIRSFRLPEPYKGKGIKYAEETIRRKVGKAAAGSTQ